VSRMLPMLGGWVIVKKSHPILLRLADRHYTRQKPGTRLCTRPGINLCFVLEDGTAAFVTWRPIPRIGRMDRLEAWECTLFRNEGGGKSSDLIREAVALIWDKWGWPPRDGLITAVGIAETASGRGKWSQPGQCFVKAGWKPIGEKNGKAWLQAPHPVAEPKQKNTGGTP